MQRIAGRSGTAGYVQAAAFAVFHSQQRRITPVLMRRLSTRRHPNPTPPPPPPLTGSGPDLIPQTATGPETRKIKVGFVAGFIGTGYNGSTKTFRLSVQPPRDANGAVTYPKAIAPADAILSVVQRTAVRLAAASNAASRAAAPSPPPPPPPPPPTESVARPSIFVPRPAQTQWVPTVEGELQHAMFQAGLIKPANYYPSPEQLAQYDPTDKISWSRSSRTDAGVHATSVVCGAKLEFADVSPRGLAQAMAAVNSHLPPHVRLFGIHRAPKVFDARRMITRRSYEYLLPPDVFKPLTSASNNASNNAPFTVHDDWKRCFELFHGSNTFRYFTRHFSLVGTNSAAPRAATPPTEADESDESDHESDAGGPTPTPTPTPPPIQHCRSWSLEGWSDRVLPEAARQFEPLPRVQQLIRVVEAIDCDTVRIGDADWVRIRVSGESFIYHQIRKMVGAIIAVARGVLPFNVFRLILKSPFAIPNPRVIPLAPAGYLLQSYPEPINSMFAWSETQLNKIEITPEQTDQMDRFKTDVIYPHIASFHHHNQSNFQHFLSNMHQEILEPAPFWDAMSLAYDAYAPLAAAARRKAFEKDQFIKAERAKRRLEAERDRDRDAQPWRKPFHSAHRK